MRKEVEELNTAWISKVSSIGVSTERHAGVRGVAFSEVGGKFPEFAVLDEVNNEPIPVKSLGSLGGRWHSRDKAEAKAVLWMRQPDKYHLNDNARWCSATCITPHPPLPSLPHK